jgi:hypothetical protein
MNYFYMITMFLNLLILSPLQAGQLEKSKNLAQKPTYTPVATCSVNCCPSLWQCSLHLLRTDTTNQPKPLQGTPPARTHSNSSSGSPKTSPALGAMVR